MPHTFCVQLTFAIQSANIVRAYSKNSIMPHGAKLSFALQSPRVGKSILKQVLNSLEGVSGTYSLKLRHIYIAPMVKSWRSESSNISFVVLDKLLFGFPEQQTLAEVNQAIQNWILGLVVRLQNSTFGLEVRLQCSTLGLVIGLEY